MPAKRKHPKQITTASKKAKGRRMQKTLVEPLNEWDSEGFYASRPMGQMGSDIVDPRGRLPWEYIEIRKHERWPSMNAIVEEMTHKGGTCWAYYLGRNHAEPVAILSRELFYLLMKTYLRSLYPLLPENKRWAYTDRMEQNELFPDPER